ncbi:carboxypeptidase regulatory-like domain-containing protein [Cryobacterium sp. SO2]|uniref:carboxypeptidase regulatory-like domain-containing protein n=1 Tax=Cryobacterium sp. SO2 TaxID=1897060 RepID=UPI00223E57D1|nr:carboxypeptidase regulatory-like domain-containing protein [Cryobacterium sp. SO2]WEO77971.1 carboxypeptidase regulatory-like domain-containing protein [Cryobacterium sp. SO2]
MSALPNPGNRRGTRASLATLLVAGLVGGLLAVNPLVASTPAQADTDPASTISGTVSGDGVNGAQAEPLPDTLVYITDENGDWLDSGYTDETGHFEVTNVPQGTYTIQFQPSNEEFAGEWWNDQATQETATYFELGSDNSGFDATLARGAKISGTVLAEGSPATALSDVYVSAFDAAGNSWGGGTNEAGEYTISGLPAGEYTLRFADNGATHLSEWWNDQPTRETAESVTVASGETLTGRDAALALAGSISGQVTDDNGAPIAYTDIYAFFADGNWGGNALTDADGRYTLTGLVPGSYALQFLDQGDRVNEWWNDKLTQETATLIDVIDGTPITGIDAQLAEGATVSGRVTSDTRDGEAISGVNVSAFQVDANGNLGDIWSGYTDAQGRYSIPGLAAGNYTLRFTSWGTSDISEWWDNKPTQYTATTFAVAAGATVTGKDAGLTAGATLTGQVVADDDGTPVSTGWVEALAADGHQVLSVSTDESGNYSLTGLPAGEYVLTFSDYNQRYTQEWWNNQTSFESAQHITVAAGATITDLNAGLALGGSITGSLSVQGGGASALEDAMVEVYTAAGDSVTSVSVDENAHYSITGLPTGDYTLRFSADQSGAFSEWWNNQPSQETAQTVAVTSGQVTTGIDAVLEQSASISGTVIGEDSAGLTDTRVRVYDADGASVSTAYTDNEGHYTVNGMRAGSYTLRFYAPNDSNYLAEWWNDKTTQESADFIELSTAEKHTGADATLAVGGSVSGRLTSETTGAAIPQGDVYLYDSNENNVGYTSVNENGEYTIKGLAAGSYTLQFNASGNFLREWYDDQPDQSTATTFTVGAGQAVTGKNAALAPGATISGTVTGGGAPLGDVSVSLSGPDFQYSNYATTDAQGRFSLIGLPAGSYTLQFSPDLGNWVSEWYNNQASSNTAEQVVVAAGEAVSGITADLAPGASIAGTVTGDTGKALASVQVSAQNRSGSISASATTDLTGAYSITGLPAGNYTLQFWDGNTGYATQWWNNQPSSTTAEYFAVAAAGAVTGKDAVLTLGATITGTVAVDGGGDPSAVRVYAYTPDGTSARSASVDAAGTYSLTSLAPGSYTLEFSSWRGVALGEWWNNQPNRESATAITVTSGQTVSGISPELAKAATISGTVTGAGSPGANLAGVQVTAYAVNGWQVASATTDGAGAYTISGLAAGDYNLQFVAIKSNFLTEWWNDQPTQSDSATITVTGGQAVTGKNAVLAASASISGSVKGAGATTVNLRDVSVTAVPLNPGQTVQYASAFTDANGNYTIRGLRAGSYSLQFSPSSDQDYLGEYWNDADSSEAASYFSVGDEQVVTGKDAVLAPGASLSGSVVGDLPAGASLDDVFIEVHRPNGDYAGYGMTDADGHFTVHGLRPGSYTLQYSVYGVGTQAMEWWNDQPTQETATTVTLSAGQKQTGLDVDFSARALTTTPTPTITGVRQVGNTLTATPGTWAPAPVTLAYQWLRAGVAIPGATASTYPLVAADAGAALTVSVTGSKSGYTAVTTESASITVDKVFTTTPAPTISGDTTVGQILTATSGSWAPVPGTLGYQWLRNGTAISGATASSYTLAAADAGTALTVTVTAAKPGYSTATQTSAATAAITGLLTATPVPGIRGTATVGQTLTVTTGTWAPATVGLAYQWSRGATAITGATAASYTVTAEDAGSTLSVTVTGSKAGYITVAKASAATAVVTGGILTATPVPTLAGTTTVGQTLTAAAGTWAPAPVTLGYQWLRSGTAISGATASTYTLVTADAGKTLTVTVTGTKAGFTTVATTSAATAAIAQPLTATPVPTITGTVKVGQILTATAGTWSPATVTLKYQWSRAGTAITGATASTYTPVTADAGATLTVTVTGSKSGYVTVAKASAATAMVTGGVLTAPASTVTGTTTVGQTLTAKAGTWTPATVTLGYQWLRSGTAISGATASTYKLVAADAGKSITVKVTGTKSGFTTVAKTSVATAAVTQSLTATPTPTITGTAKVGQTLTAKTGTWTPATVTLKYQWLRAGKAIAGATASTYKLVTADAGATLTVTVTGSKAGYVTVAKTSAATALITGGVLTAAPVPTVAGTAKVGQTLTAKAGTWAPATVTLGYQWLRGGRAITGATKSTYKPVAADVSKTLTVKVTGAKSGFTTVAKTSVATAKVVK